MFLRFRSRPLAPPGVTAPILFRGDVTGLRCRLSVLIFGLFSVRLGLSNLKTEGFGFRFKHKTESFGFGFGSMHRNPKIRCTDNTGANPISPISKTFHGSNFNCHVLDLDATENRTITCDRAHSKFLSNSTPRDNAMHRHLHRC